MSTRPLRIVGAVVVVLTLAACASSAVAESGGEPTSSAAPVAPVAMPTPTPSPTLEPVVDPSDVTTWTVSAERIGPIVRGGAYADLVPDTAAFTVTGWCQGVMAFDGEGTAQFVIRLSDDEAQVRAVWVVPGAVEEPLSPATAEGIRLGSTAAALTAAYPDLVTVVQRGADTWGYAVGSDADGWLQFIVENDAVVLMGASERQMAPKEWCA